LSLEPLHSFDPTMIRAASPAASPIGIRPYQDRDLEAVFQVFDQPQCRRFLGREPFKTEAEVKAWFDILPKKTAKLVATQADVPVAIGLLAPDGGSRAHVGVLSLFVHDRFRRLGIGSKLLQFLLASGRFYRLLRLELSVVCDNEAALRLYHKSGFQIEGRLAGALRYDGRFHDAYVMSLLGHELAAALDAQSAWPQRHQRKLSPPFDARAKPD
jgi:putative acetyltransferase